ncbi:hypothetical protein BRADI_2g22795v3 [Brachypodium distachyon]|uniref:DUF4283 domain-containing protein n=1 Tax=Brachypodium distachyon TaxID=15368 RepID=A0A2K2D9X6_BRADI|nr:hypothetical protein BRADI_2g22795v3 [Brachypodium distachyon]
MSRAPPPPPPAAATLAPPADACDEEEEGEFIPDLPLAQIQPLQKQIGPGSAYLHPPAAEIPCCSCPIRQPLGACPSAGRAPTHRPSPPLPGMATQGFGALGTRPEEDTYVIPFSYNIGRETTAAIASAVNTPRRLDALDVDRAIRAEFRIRHADIVVTPHHPEQFLVKFANKAHCDEVLARGQTTARGLSVRIRPYRPLEHAFAAAMAFRVHLRLEKVTAFAWTPCIVERIIGRRCSFDQLDRRSAFMEQTDTLDLWAWTTNPSLIPKVMWVSFMGRSLDEHADEILVTDYRPSGVKQGSSYRVIIHLDTVEDYTAAPLDYNTSSGKPPLLKPRITTFNCVIGTIDGVPPPAATAAPELRDDADLRARRRRGRGNDHPRQLPRCREDDDDDRRGHRSPRRASGERDSGENLLAFRRERTLSPRRHDSDSGRHGHRRGPETCPGAGSAVGLHAADPELQELFDVQAKEIQAGLTAHASLPTSLQPERAEELRRCWIGPRPTFHGRRQQPCNWA